MSWIQQAFSFHSGCIRSVRWEGLSQFRVELGLCPSIFRRVSLAVRLQPREMPLNWLISRLQGRRETVTFEAELEHSPCFNLHVHNYEWRAGTRRRPRPARKWHFESVRPTVISTVPDAEENAGQILEVLLAIRSGNFLNVSFRRRAPHFLACAPLQSLSPETQNAGMFEVLRELATSASTPMP